MKYNFDGAFEAFLDDHKEFTKEHADLPESPHTPKFEEIPTTAEEEFNVYSALKVLNEKELLFAYRLLVHVSIQDLRDMAEEDQDE